MLLSFEHKGDTVLLYHKQHGLKIAQILPLCVMWIKKTPDRLQYLPKHLLGHRVWKGGHNCDSLPEKRISQSKAKKGQQATQYLFIESEKLHMTPPSDTKHYPSS